MRSFKPCLQIGKLQYLRHFHGSDFRPVYTPTFEQQIMKTLKKERRKTRRETQLKDNVGDYMGQLLRAGFDGKNPQQKLLQDLWHQLREFFAYHQALSDKVMQAILNRKYINNPVTKKIIPILTNYDKLKDTELFWAFEKFYYSIPYSTAVTILNNESQYNNKNFSGKRIIEVYFSEEDEKHNYANSPLMAKDAMQQFFHSNDTLLNDKPGEKFWILKPDMMRDVAIPAYNEEETKSFLSRKGYQVKELPSELFEIADVFVPKYNLLIDNKSYSHQIFNNLGDKELAEMVTKAREKLKKTQTFYGEGNFRLVYVTRNWWDDLYGKQESFCVCRGKTKRTTHNKEDFDVAFLTTNHNQDFSYLEQLLSRINKFRFLNGDNNES